MKNFLQFIIPILVIVLVGAFLSRTPVNNELEESIIISCKSQTKTFSLDIGNKIKFDKCNLELEVLNVAEHHAKLKTNLLWKIDRSGNKLELTDSVLIDFHDPVTYYLKDQDEKVTFEVK